MQARQGVLDDKPFQLRDIIGEIVGARDVDIHLQGFGLWLHRLALTFATLDDTSFLLIEINKRGYRHLATLCPQFARRVGTCCDPAVVGEAKSRALAGLAERPASVRR